MGLAAIVCSTVLHCCSCIQHPMPLIKHSENAGKLQEMACVVKHMALHPQTATQQQGLGVDPIGSSCRQQRQKKHLVGQLNIFERWDVACVV